MSRITRRLVAAAGLMTAAALVATGCTNSSGNEDEGGSTANTATSNNDEPGETVTIGFSGPALDHGWLGAIATAAKAEAKEYEDRSEEHTSELQSRGQLVCRPLREK